MKTAIIVVVIMDIVAISDIKNKRFCRLIATKRVENDGAMSKPIFEIRDKNQEVFYGRHNCKKNGYLYRERHHR